MARIRSIKPDFFMDETVAEVSPLARLLLIGLWTLADKDGQLEDRPKRIKASLFPYDTTDVEPLLSELAQRGVIVRYEAGGQACIAIPTFLKEQRPHPKETSFGLPPPPVPGRFAASRELSRQGVEASRRVPVVVGCGSGCGNGSTPLKPPTPSAEGGAPTGSEGTGKVVSLPTPTPPRRARQESARVLAVAETPPLAEARDVTGLLAYESGHTPVGEDLPSQVHEAFLSAMGMPYRWDMRRDERAANELLAAAGADGAAEVIRRWRIGLQNQGFPRVRSLADLAKRWNDCAQPAGGSPASRAADGLTPGAANACEGCGRAGQGAEVGGGPGGAVWLGYACGCGAAWKAELDGGRPYTAAAVWARERRAGRGS